MSTNNKNKINILEHYKILRYFEKQRSLEGLCGFSAFICLCLGFKESSSFYIVIALGIIVSLCGIRFVRWLLSRKRAKLLLIKCTSFTDTECNQPLPAYIYENYGIIKEININQCKFTKNNSVTNLVKSYKKLQKGINKVCKKTLKSQYDVSLCARYHIPFMFYLGCNLSTLHIKFFEVSRCGCKLIEIKSSSKNFPTLNISNHVDKDEQILNILISVSLKINPNDIPNLSSYTELFLDEPCFDAIISNEQLEDYSSKLFNILNNCQKNHIRRVNIYYAGPMSLAFKLGQIVKLTMHPEIYVYNFSNFDSPKYGWALRLSNSFDKSNIEDQRVNKDV